MRIRKAVNGTRPCAASRRGLGLLIHDGRYLFLPQLPPEQGARVVFESIGFSVAPRILADYRKTGFRAVSNPRRGNNRAERLVLHRDRVARACGARQRLWPYALEFEPQ